MDLTPLLAIIPPQYFVYVTAAWAILKFINAAFPQPAPDSPWYAVRAIIRVMVCNFGHAADVIPPPLSPAGTTSDPATSQKGP